MIKIKKLVKYLSNMFFKQNPTNIKAQKAPLVC